MEYNYIELTNIYRYISSISGHKTKIRYLSNSEGQENSNEDIDSLIKQYIRKGYRIVSCSWSDSTLENVMLEQKTSK